MEMSLKFKSNMTNRSIIAYLSTVLNFGAMNEGSRINNDNIVFLIVC